MEEGRIIANEVLIGQVCSLLAEGKRVRLRAKGDSMRPFIRGEEDVMLLAPADAPRRGDVVLARTEDGDYVVHRILRLDDDRAVLGGDGNLFRREICLRSEIYGIVEAVVCNGKVRSMRGFPARMLALGWRLSLPFRRGWSACRRLCHIIRSNMS